MYTVNYFSFLNKVSFGGKKNLKGRYVFNWGGWAGASEGRVITKFFPNCGGSNPFYSRLGEGHSFFGKEKITPCHLVDVSPINVIKTINVIPTINVIKIDHKCNTNHKCNNF